MAPERIAPTAREIELHSPWMRRLARALVGEADAADDVVQDVWVQLAGSPPERGSHVGYLIALVRSLVHSRRRGDARRSLREARAARLEALPSTAEVAARIEVARRLADALEQLDEPYRTTLVLRYYDELSAAEIARRAGIPAGTVRARLKRGLDLLRDRLDDGDGGRASWMSALMPLLPAHPRTSAAGAATTSAATLTVSALLAMKITLGATLCVLVALLAWTFVDRERVAERALDASVDDGAALVASDLVAVEDGAQRRATTLDGTAPPVALGEARANGAASSDSRVAIIARAIARDGRPIQGAWLRVSFADQYMARAELDGRIELMVEREVLQRLATVTERHFVELRMGAEGFSSRSVEATLAEGSERLILGDVMLRPGGTVHGRVVDAGGLGVEGALVVFGAPALREQDAAQRARNGPRHLAPEGQSGIISPAYSTRSGAGGAFRIDGVPVAYGIAWARTTTSFWATSAPVGVRAGEDVRGIELVVDDAQGDVISGRVVDPDGRAVPGVELTFQRSGDSEGGISVKTDQEGCFHFAASNGEVQDLSVRSPSLEWANVERAAVAPGTHELELAFERARWLEVEVVDDEGRPVVNGRARGLPGAGATDYPLPRCEAPLDGAGRARLSDPGCELRVRIEAPGYRDALVGPFEPSAFPAPLVVTLTPVRALVGRVLLPDGRPAARARVSLHESASAPGTTSSPPGAPFTDPSSSGDRDTFHQSGSGPGTTASLRATHFTHPSWSGDRNALVYALQFNPTEAVRADDEGRFRLTLPGVDARAAEESDVRPVEFLGELNAFGSASWRLATVDPRQPWFVHAQADGHATVTSGPHVFDPRRDVSLDLQLPPGGAIAGRLLLAGMGSPHGWTAFASDGLAEAVRAMVGEDGTFRFEHLHAGPWQVRVFEPDKRFYAGGRSLTQRMPAPDVHVLAGETVEYEHRADVVERAQLSGQLMIDGAPPGALRVTVRTATPELASTSAESTLDPDGRFEVTLRPGSRTMVRVTGPYRGSQLTLYADIEVAPGDNEWSFSFETARLEVHVDPTGIPASRPRAALYVAERGPVTLSVVLQASEPGHFAPQLVPAGRGRLDGRTNELEAPEPAWAELDLAPGELRVLDLR